MSLSNTEPDQSTDNVLYFDRPNVNGGGDSKMVHFTKVNGTWWVSHDDEIAKPVTRTKIGLIFNEHLRDLGTTLHGMHEGHELMPKWAARHSRESGFIWSPSLIWQTVLTCRPGATIHQGPCVRFTNRGFFIRPETAILKTFCPRISTDRIAPHFRRAFLNFGPEHRDWESTKKYQTLFNNILLPGVGSIVRGYLTGWRLTGAEFQRFVLGAFSEIVPASLRLNMDGDGGGDCCCSEAINDVTQWRYHESNFPGYMTEIQFKSKILKGKVGEPVEFQINWSGAIIPDEH